MGGYKNSVFETVVSPLRQAQCILAGLIKRLSPSWHGVSLPTKYMMY